MNVVAYGGGTNSTAMLIGMAQHGIAADLILFADTGGEHPYTYEYLSVMNAWLLRHGMPEIIVVEYRDHNGERLTLEQECLRSGALPSLAYGFKKCSLKHKIGPQDKFCNNNSACRQAWSRGERIKKYVGYDSREEYRKLNAREHDLADSKYEKVYPLLDWGWSRDDCVNIIQQEGLPLPGKSSCFFCPAMKRREIRALYNQHPDLFQRAIAIEQAAMPNLTTVKGLARNWSWQDFAEADRNQLAIPEVFAEAEWPCGCFGEEAAP